MDVAVLVSPAAGRGRARAVGGLVVDALRDAGLTPHVLPATTGADAERQAGRAVAAGAGAVIAVGGDGTAHAAVQAVAGTGIPMAGVPAGTRNHPAVGPGIPSAAPAAPP